ncbi:7-cyano-7-deazaguanine synthase QueC [Bacillus alkalicellulosilyticus]|uniref:7-cyano-7-deazaguanine synthase QueC n=1 Tax=Alkalihalobacterium alkalicellulosilyticum TaxID=1912214 RepID=UPI0009960EB2|nr:7-cyano-7-deazaguanine synthase QueC [Bacillus alkalicellulosilyticus]
MRKAVIVLSGGLDSTTCMGIAKEKGYELYPITFHYGQKHNIEVQQAQKVSQFYNTKDHRIVDIGFLQQIGGSALTDSSIPVPTDMEYEADSIPSTYVPARNMIFLALASAYAEVIGAEAIYIGVSAVDYSGYPDCRPEFITSMTETVNLATKQGVTGGSLSIETPLIHLTKKETIEEGLRLQVPYHLTTSCYNGGETACGKCDSCLLRIKGFKEANGKDPIAYEIKVNW